MFSNPEQPLNLGYLKLDLDYYRAVNFKIRPPDKTVANKSSAIFKLAIWGQLFVKS
jgi:hypothetical protein